PNTGPNASTVGVDEAHDQRESEEGQAPLEGARPGEMGHPKRPVNGYENERPQEHHSPKLEAQSGQVAARVARPIDQLGKDHAPENELLEDRRRERGALGLEQAGQDLFS